MIVDTKSKQIYKAETWIERFRVSLSEVLWHSMEEGSPLPRWFIPVRREPNRDTIELWILPLALPVWAYYTVSDVFWCVWQDMFRWGSLVREWKIKKGYSETSSDKRSK